MKNLKYQPIQKTYKAFECYNIDYEFNPSNNIRRYTEWRAFTDKKELYPSEFLLPQLVKNIKITEFPFMTD